MKDHEKTIKSLNVNITYNNYQRAFFYNTTLHYIMFTYNNVEYIYSASNLGSYVFSKKVGAKEEQLCATRNYQEMENAILEIGN